MTRVADGFSEYYYVKEYLVALGLPPLDDDAYPPCGVTGLNGDCSRDREYRHLLHFVGDIKQDSRIPPGVAAFLPSRCPCVASSLLQYRIHPDRLRYSRTNWPELHRAHTRHGNQTTWAFAYYAQSWRCRTGGDSTWR